MSTKLASYFKRYHTTLSLYCYHSLCVHEIPVFLSILHQIYVHTVIYIDAFISLLIKVDLNTQLCKLPISNMVTVYRITVFQLIIVSKHCMIFYDDNRRTNI